MCSPNFLTIHYSFPLLQANICIQLQVFSHQYTNCFPLVFMIYLDHAKERKKNTFSIFFSVIKEFYELLIRELKQNRRKRGTKVLESRTRLLNGILHLGEIFYYFKCTAKETNILYGVVVEKKHQIEEITKIAQLWNLPRPDSAMKKKGRKEEEEVDLISLVQGSLRSEVHGNRFDIALPLWIGRSGFGFLNISLVLHLSAG